MSSKTTRLGDILPQERPGAGVIPLYEIARQFREWAGKVRGVNKPG